ncbi:site-specific integrase [Massiliimalia massiliensis]|uniref:site-specific integrase n=1 Tax=Massiliimalia massiliensis TaxID=1852384 RepID=UPI000984949B|nr:site-specific integrase [Massiliimalia massiliensis]
MAQVTCMKRGKKWQYRFEGAPVNGKRQRFTKSGFSTKKEAMTAGTKALAEYENSGLRFIPSEISYSDYLDYWLKEYCQINLKECSYLGYQKKINNYIRPVLGKYHLHSITPAILQQFLNEKFNEGFSRNTLICLKALLSGSLSYAVEPLRFIQSNPMQGIKLPSPRAKADIPTRSHPREIILENEWNKIISRFPFGNSCYIPLLLAYRCGLRLGEAFAIDRKHDIDWEHGILDINKQVQNLKGYWTFTEPKYNSFRKIKLDKITLEELRKVSIFEDRAIAFYRECYIHLYENPKRQIVTEKGVDCKEIHMLNVRENGSFISPRIMMHCARVIHYDLGYAHYTYHALRHTHTTMLIERGAYIKDVQERLGHKSVQVTLQIYTHITQAMKQQTTNILENIPVNGNGSNLQQIQDQKSIETILQDVSIYPQKSSSDATSPTHVPNLGVQNCTPFRNSGYNLGTNATFLSSSEDFETKKEPLNEQPFLR